MTVSQYAIQIKEGRKEGTYPYLTKTSQFQVGCNILNVKSKTINLPEDNIEK